MNSLSTLGTVAVVAALAFAVWGLITSALGGARKDPRLAEAGRRAALPVLLFATAAVAVLEYALLTNDTSVRYVAMHSASVSPLWVKIVSLWGALEGSILFWAWLLAIYVFVASRVSRDDALRPYAMATMYFVLIFFLVMNASLGNPFTPVVNPPADGRGPNALLQNHWMMAVHPVLMYLGFVGLTVPFAYAVSALITGRLGEGWLAQTRRWTMVAWAFLSAAIISGGWWSYEVLGWGGYWAWDPVENASIIPWFMATAFLHSVQIQERRRVLKGWNLGLIVAAFGATVLGTFITRSGIIESVHAFAAGPIGPAFLVFLAIVLLGTVGLAFVRLPLIRDDAALDSPISREGAFLAGNLIFSAFAFTTVLGTLFPVIVEAIRGQKASVGAPFFNQVAIPLGLALLILQAFGPALTWRRVEKQALANTMRWPLILSAASVVVAVALGVREWSVAATIFAAMLNVTVLWTLTGRAIGARRRAQRANPLSALGTLVNENPRRYGAYITHLAVAIIAVGISFSGAYKKNENVRFTPGDSKTVLGTEITYVEMRGAHLPEKSQVAAMVLMGGKHYYPMLNYYGTERQPVATPAIWYTALGDTYTTLLSFDMEDGSVVLDVIRSPLVSWIWIGSVLLILGSLLTLVPAVVEEPKTARKPARASAPQAASD